MNFRISLSHQPHTLAGRSELKRQLTLWLGLLTKCAKKPSRKRIHTLRVATLRLQARVEQEFGTAGSEQRSVKRWNRQAEKLRNLIGTVRETDVYLGKLDQLRNSIAGPEQCQSRLARMCLRQIDAVEERMKQDRKTAARKAADEIKNRLPRFDHLSRELEAELLEPVHRSENSGMGRVREMIRALASQLPQLNAENLHEFRKQVKKVRYVAEIAGDPVATRQLSALRRMQSAAGLWHDWQALAKRVGRTLRGKDKSWGLAELLNTMAEESLEKALEICRRNMERLLNNGAGAENSPNIFAPKSPVRSEGPMAAPEERYA